MIHWSELIVDCPDGGQYLYPDEEHRHAVLRFRAKGILSGVDFTGIERSLAEEVSDSVEEEMAAEIIFAARVGLLASASKVPVRASALSLLRNHGVEIQLAIAKAIKEFS